MPIQNCRLCETPLPAEPIMSLNNVPAQIQAFLTESELSDDHGVDLHVFRCVGCGLIQLNSDPVIYDTQATSTTAYYQNMMDLRRQQAHDLITEFDLAGKTILDVGCGDGHLLEIITDEGAVAVGVDASEHALSLARSKGLNVHYGHISRGNQVEGAPFDAFMSTDVIEHVPDVKDFLQGINGNLRPGAVGLIETPSFEKALEDHRFYEFITDHLSYFTAETLRTSLELTGFDVLRIERNRDGENLTAIIRKRQPDQLEKLLDYTETLKNSFAAFMGQIEDGRVALWGASLQTMTLSTLMPLDSIAYIVDSAPYKQGKYTPVSHLPIVGPEALASDPVSAIIVAAPRYREQIIEQIRALDSFTGTIAALDGEHINIVQEA